MHVTASLGIAISDDNATPESLLRDSDSAMYRAKELGRGRIELFDAALRLNANRRLATASALHRALERGEFVVHYQPVVDLDTGSDGQCRGTGPLEASRSRPRDARTNSFARRGDRPHRSDRRPRSEQACMDLAEWQRLEARRGQTDAVRRGQPLGPPDVGAWDRRDCRRCLDTHRSATRRSVPRVDRERVHGDVEYFGKNLTSLKEIGVDLSIDDFGTGYSSLSYLKRFPVDGVKVDRVFVDGLGTDPHDTALVEAIVAMASALELQVTAEGVETHEQLLELKSLGVPRAQGFFLDRPMAADEISRRIAESNRWDVS